MAAAESLTPLAMEANESQLSLHVNESLTVRASGSEPSSLNGATLTPLSSGPTGSQPSLLSSASLTPANAGPNESQPSLLSGTATLTSQHSLSNNQPKHGVEAFLLGDDDLEPLHRTTQGLRGWPKFLLRSLKLLVFKSWVAPRLETSLKEEKKIAFRRDRKYAAAYGLIIHLLPAGAALALIVLNSTQYYVGGELAGPSGQDDQKLGALTFVAKLHELLMLASLAAVLLAYFRRELLYELWGVFCAELGKQRKKWTLISLLIICTLLGVSVGPSTNNLMRPRLDWWDAGGTTFWINATMGELQPSTTEVTPSLKHCNIDTGDAACPYGDWEIINRQYHSYWPRLEPMGDMPELLGITSPFSEREMVLRHRSTEEDLTSTIWQNAFSMASIQHSVVVDGLAEVGRLWAYAAANAGERQKYVFRRDAQYSTSAPQPLTQARCEESIFSKDNVSSIQLSFPLWPALTCNGDDSNCFMDPTNFFNASSNATLLDITKTLLLSGGAPALTWLETDVVPIFSNSSIHVIATFPSTTAGDLRIYCCSIDSVYTPAEVLASRGAPKAVTGYPGGMLGDGTSVEGAQRITISGAWAELLYPEIPSLNATVFTQMVSTAGMWNSNLVSQTYNFPFIVESILATSVTNGLARSTYNRTMLGSLKDSNEATRYGTDRCGGSWEQEMLPKTSLGLGGSAFDISSQDQQGATMLIMYATVNGYAWSSRGTLQKAAIVVLAIYTAFAISHFVYLVATGYMSLAWDKTPEMISLAMNSQSTAALRNTGAGIDTIQPYKAKVKIKVGPQGHLEYIFEDSLGYKNFVRCNEPYA